MNEARRPRLFRALDARGKAVRVVAAVFLVVHLASMLAGGAVPAIERRFEPVLGFYMNGLRMTNAWGMFGKAPTQTNVAVEGVRADGSVVTLSTTDAHGHGLADRVRDARIRKFEGRLGEDDERPRIGDAFLAYFCRTRPDASIVRVRAKNFIHELRDDDGRITRPAYESIVLERSCANDP